MGIPILTVTQLNTYVKSVIDSDDRLSLLYLNAEISNFTNHYRTGHFYMTLKDENSSVKAVMFKSEAMRLRFMPENGMKVLIRGRLSVFPRDGQYQVYIDDMQPDGTGALHMAFEQLKAKLLKEGLFDEDKKKPLPRYPMRVGVVTSSTGAAIKDIINVLGRRFPMSTVVLCPVQVQGVSAAPQICEAIKLFNREKAADVLIVGRGGGSIEDLWAFNEESVARAVYNSEIPVISAVGHETDFTICDFVSDLRAPTPSAAAELCVPDRFEESDYIYAFSMRCRRAILSKTETERKMLLQTEKSAGLKNPLHLIDTGRINLDKTSSRIDSVMKMKITGNRAELSRLAGKADAMSPLKVLSRGYAIAEKENKAVASISEIKDGDSLIVRFADGEAGCTVTEVNKYEKNDL